MTKRKNCLNALDYAWPGDQLYSVFTDCIAICYRTQLTPTKNISKAFERTPFIVGKTLQSDSCMSKSKEQIHTREIQCQTSKLNIRCVNLKSRTPHCYCNIARGGQFKEKESYLGKMNQLVLAKGQKLNSAQH